jgi:hypothetical protein
MSWPSVITLAAVGLAAAVLLWWWVPKWQMRSITAADPKARADIEDNFRKTIGQLLGGAAVLIGAVSAYLQFTQQQQASQQQFSQQQQAAQQQFSQQQQAAHELLISNQVGRGFEQLGSANIMVRLGGIYALEGVMNTSDQYHRPVLETLCAFVRDRTKTETGDGPPATEIQAALTVIGRRKVIGDERLNLMNAHIPKANMFEATLHDFYFVNANLAGAYLFHADLRSAILNNANLTGATLLDANLTGANLYAANLTGANLKGADLIGANLTGADLTGAIVTQAQLDQACARTYVKHVKLDAGLSLNRPCP